MTKNTNEYETLYGLLIAGFIVALGLFAAILSPSNDEDDTTI